MNFVHAVKHFGRTIVCRWMAANNVSQFGLYRINDGSQGLFEKFKRAFETER